MTKRMLIDATHAEETRVVVLDGTRLEEYDVETATKRQLKGNIYLAKVVRVEPSLQAAFIEYGGNRHGFLAFGEIHPDYYQIPVADRQRLLAAQAEAARLEQEEEDRAAAHDEAAPSDESAAAERAAEAEARADEAAAEAYAADERAADERATDESANDETAAPGEAMRARPATIPTERIEAPEAPASDDTQQAAGTAPTSAAETEGAEPLVATTTAAEDGMAHADPAADLPPPETVGGEADGEADQHSRSIPIKYLRNYKIQEVIKRRQIMLVQVVKEERGSKGAALTTYLSLAGRYCVLMPNSPRGGGISRKITSAADRKRLKEVMAELDIPNGMGLIVRTAGANRPKPEIRRDCEYLMRLWDDIREHTMQSVAPALIYEEASLIKRAIRDVYSRDVDEIVVDGEEAWRAARNFMNMLIPSHARKVILHKDTDGATAPLFTCHQVEAQLDSMLNPTVQLKSGGYLVINQAEALVAIDVNSGRSTRERNIEETALRTNLEAADEVARQLRLRDLAGLIVIDFIDMESKKHNAMVERRIKDALKGDRARIQVGHISHFGLLEMSRQRLRPSLAETNFTACPHCNGLGLVRTTESAAIHVLRAVEEEGAKQRAAEVMVHVAPALLLYLFNQKRDRLAAIERRYQMRVLFDSDPTLSGTQHRIDRLRAQVARDAGRDDYATVDHAPVAMLAPPPADTLPSLADLDDDADIRAPADDMAAESATTDEDPAKAARAGGGPTERGEAGAEGDGDRPRRRRRRRRRGGRREDAGTPGETDSDDDAEDGDTPLAAADAAGFDGEAVGSQAAPHDTQTDMPSEAPAEVANQGAATEAAVATGEPGEGAAEDPDGAKRRRSRRGGRRRRREPGEADATLPDIALPGSEQPELPARAYAGPTPADPFAGQTFDIFDVMEQAEARAAAAALRAPAAEAPPPETPMVEPLAETEVAEAPAAGARAAETPSPAAEPTASIPPQEAADEAAPEPEAAPPEAAPPEAALRDAAPEPAAAAPATNGAAPHATPDATEATAADGEASGAATAETEPEPAPAASPIVVGTVPVAERKQGWWRR